MGGTHDYACRIEWTGNRGDGTRGYAGSDRTCQVATPGRPVIRRSNDPLLGGDPALPNPEDMLLASLSACHRLWCLHLASEPGIAVHRHADEPTGVGKVGPDGAGRFLRATLRPRIAVAAGTDLARAAALHGEVDRYRFIARSLNSPVGCEPGFGTVAGRAVARGRSASWSGRSDRRRIGEGPWTDASDPPSTRLPPPPQAKSSGCQPKSGLVFQVR